LIIGEMARYAFGHFLACRDVEDQNSLENIGARHMQRGFIPMASGATTRWLAPGTTNHR
jgi:hypothetical protein